MKEISHGAKFIQIERSDIMGSCLLSETAVRWILSTMTFTYYQIENEVT